MQQGHTVLQYNSKPPVHPDKGELFVGVKAPCKAMEDAALVKTLGPAAVLPLQSYQPFKAILLVLPLEIGHLGREDSLDEDEDDSTPRSLACWCQR